MADTRKQEIFKDSVRKEDRLRLKWFYKNEERLVSFAEKPLSRTVPAETLDNMKNDRVSRYQGVEKQVRGKGEQTPEKKYDPNKILPLMKPVDPEHEKLLYTGTQKDGRINYLTKRVKVLPENRYYNPETTSFQYGWCMWNASRTATDARYGRCQIINNSFYRRNGVAPDPPWYREPLMLSPNVCNCS